MAFTRRWQLIDMSFGVIGIIPLIVVYRLIRRLEREQLTASTLRVSAG